MKRDGKTEREAEELTRQIGRAASIMAKPESERTAEERAFLDRVEQNPDMQRYMAAADRFVRQQNPESNIKAHSVMSGSTQESVMSGSTAFETFPSAPSASSHHRAALAATTPLDTPRVPASPAIERPASAPTVDSGFAV